MARPQEFDRDIALKNAMSLFWQQGYSATSLQQLLKTTGLSRSSLYASFGDKRHLFIESMELFFNKTYQLFAERAAPSQPLQQIRCFFKDTLFAVPERRRCRGCMLVNTLLEMAEVDDELCQLAAEKLKQVEQSFAATFQNAIEQGHISNQHTAEQLAALTMTLNKGLRVASREKASRTQMLGTINSAFSLMGISPLEPINH